MWLSKPHHDVFTTHANVYYLYNALFVIKDSFYKTPAIILSYHILYGKMNIGDISINC